MTRTEELAFRVRVDIELLDLVKNEVVRVRKFLRQEHAPLTPDRRADVFEALNLLQGRPT
jgi:hypothetical protein